MKCPWFRKECHCELKAKQSLVALFVVLLLCAFSACTDYVQQMEDEHETWRAQRAEKDLEQSSFPISESALSSETRRSSSSEASVLVEESSSAESILSSSDEAESSSSDFGEFESVSETIKRLPVAMFDWLHGNNGDGNGEGKNGDPINGVSADFGSGGCAASGGPMKGMVEEQLGANGVPVRADPFPSRCNITEHLNSWFLPETLGVDSRGNKLTNMTCRNLYISMDDEGGWLAEVSRDTASAGNEASRGGMFLLDDFKYLDSNKTIPNPYYDQLTGADGERHNFGFTMIIKAVFEYEPGLYFDFLGDDDVWVFIDRRLAVDIGGQHGQVACAVDLDTIGQNTGDKLVPGKIYDFHIFYAERHTSSSNFRMHTSIDLKPSPDSPCH